MKNQNVLKFNVPALFSPSVVRGLTDGDMATGFVNYDEVSDRNIGTSSSFRYDPPGSALRSTQQIPLDWEKFENHTFFQSAQVNTHLSFHKIIDQYPFDGTRNEIEEFLDSLTGFEKYVFDQFPKSKNFLYFSGVSGLSPSGTYIDVKDFAGSTYSSISKNKTGDSKLNPGFKSISFECQLFLPAQTNDNQVVLQKLSGTSQGISLFISQSALTTTASLIFRVVSGSSHLEASASFPKGQFNHVVATLNRRSNVNKAQLYVNEVLINESTNSINIGEIDFNVSSLYIGSGSSMAGGFTFTPQQTLSGAMDELRIFHDIRTIEQQKSFARKSIFSQPDLKLYFKFNEPTGTFGPTTGSSANRVVLDYSGNSLHSIINESGFTPELRVSGSLNNPMTLEKLSLSPVLFPNDGRINTLNTLLLTSASIYDQINPNLITKLVPPHLLLDGQIQEAFETPDGTLVDLFTGTSIPGSGELGQTQIIQTLLFTWAKFFDELKIYIDSFSKFLTVDYEDNNTIPDQFLIKLAEYYGITLPNLFNDSSVEQFIDAENLDVGISTGQQSLQVIQNNIWRRILVNINDIIKSKGTLHSVKSFIKTLGIDPDSNFRIREYGGPTRMNLKNQRELRTEVSSMLDFSGSNNAFIISGFLSSSRIETGFPEVAGTMVSKSNFPPHGIATTNSNGLWTSGSFSIEGIYKFEKDSVLTSISQSLFRLQAMTGSNTGVLFLSGSQGILFNCVAISGSITGSSLTGTSARVELWARPSFNSISSGTVLRMVLTGVNIFDGNKWNVSAGMFRSDDPSNYLEDFSVVKPNLNSLLASSTYFLRVARSEYGEIKEIYTTQSFFLEDLQSQNNNGFRRIDSTNNASGTVLVVGRQRIFSGTNVNFRYLNNSTFATEQVSRALDFNGKVSQLRFWSKGLLLSEWKEHVKNFKSLGISNPRANFNFNTSPTGAFERLRLDISTDQPITSSSTVAEISLFDFSQNNLHMSGTMFQTSSLTIKPETFYYSYISPKFDESVNINKVRARSFLDYNRAIENNANYGALYELDPNELPQDDSRFSIDFSIIDTLNQDIISIFSTLKELDSLIGNPELLYTQRYQGLENLRDIYFRRLNDKINLKSFFDFFKWFDRSVGNFIGALLPRKTKFRGINFVIESHMLERNKYEHKNIEQFFTDQEKNSLKGQIIVKSIESKLGKY